LANRCGFSGFLPEIGGRGNRAMVPMAKRCSAFQSDNPSNLPLFNSTCEGLLAPFADKYGCVSFIRPIFAFQQFPFASRSQTPMLKWVKDLQRHTDTTGVAGYVV
jgi:hypothetical protein